MQEITCLTSALALWFGETIDFLASERKAHRSEEGLHAVPTKSIAEAKITDYACVILTGTINPLPALFDERLIAFLKSGEGTDVVFAAISSAPLLLAKAGALKGRKFTAGFFMQMADVFPFVEKENLVHEGSVCDGNVITGIGMFFREFAQAVLRRFDRDVGENFMRERPDSFTEKELTFYWTDAEYQEFLEELKAYQE